MKTISIAKTTDKAITLEESGNSGKIQCECGEIYAYSSRTEQNMVEWAGFIVPSCPSCNCVPNSSSRRMDL